MVYFHLILRKMFQMDKSVQELIVWVIIIDQSNGFCRNLMVFLTKKSETYRSFFHWPWTVIFIKYPVIFYYFMQDII